MPDPSAGSSRDSFDLAATSLVGELNGAVSGCRARLRLFLVREMLILQSAVPDTSLIGAANPQGVDLPRGKWGIFDILESWHPQENDTTDSWAEEHWFQRWFDEALAFAGVLVRDRTIAAALSSPVPEWYPALMALWLAEEKSLPERIGLPSDLVAGQITAPDAALFSDWIMCNRFGDPLGDWVMEAIAAIENMTLEDAWKMVSQEEVASEVARRLACHEVEARRRAISAEVTARRRTARLEFARRASLEPWRDLSAASNALYGCELEDLPPLARPGATLMAAQKACLSAMERAALVESERLQFLGRRAGWITDVLKPLPVTRDPYQLMSWSHIYLSDARTWGKSVCPWPSAPESGIEDHLVERFICAMEEAGYPPADIVRIGRRAPFIRRAARPRFQQYAASHRLPW